MLASYPIQINNQDIPLPVSWSEASETVENVAQTEAGTDQVIVVRRDKLTASATFHCSSKWAGTFAILRDTEPLTVKIYDAKSNTYKQRSMRIRSFSTTLIENSDRTEGTEGLYEVSFELKEY